MNMKIDNKSRICLICLIKKDSFYIYQTMLGNYLIWRLYEISHEI